MTLEGNFNTFATSLDHQGKKFYSAIREPVLNIQCAWFWSGGVGVSSSKDFLVPNCAFPRKLSAKK